MEENGYLHVDGEILKEIDEKMPPEEELSDLAEFFKVFGDSTRLKILYVLLSAEMCVYDIAAVLGMSQSAISHQLRVLKQMDLVKNRREGIISRNEPGVLFFCSSIFGRLEHIIAAAS